MSLVKPDAFATYASASATTSLPDWQSARKLMTRGQQVFFTVVGAGVLAALWAGFWPTLIALHAVVIGGYLTVLVYRLWLFRRSARQQSLVQVSDEAARAMSDDDLPVYTVLVACYREPETMRQLARSLGSLEYPRDKLDIKLLLEPDDPDTLAAAIEAGLESWIEVLIVPDIGPRTKPKALNVGLSRARGHFVTVYDTEDIPDPLQLRRAVAAFQAGPKDLACLQCKLAFFNASQNWLTQSFEVEYATWFGFLLPSLVGLDVAMPLGGTSNHFKRSVLDEVGAWDAYNVTEDADLGLRLHRRGYRVAMLDSSTLEEANSDAINWLKQRSRWQKGYLSTWLVQVRSPRRLLSEVGFKGFVSMNLFLAGTPVLALANALMWAMTLLWFVSAPGWIPRLLPGALYYLSMASLLLGNFVCTYLNAISARLVGRPELVFVALFVPFYWALMSIASIKAVWQLVRAPSFWEKTTHGLASVEP